MLDDWTSEEGAEVVEVGSGVLVVIVVFVFGAIGKVICASYYDQQHCSCLIIVLSCALFSATVMWFWPHMSLEMKMRFIRLLPCCFKPDDDVSRLTCHFPSTSTS